MNTEDTDNLGKLLEKFPSVAADDDGAGVDSRELDGFADFRELVETGGFDERWIFRGQDDARLPLQSNMDRTKSVFDTKGNAEWFLSLCKELKIIPDNVGCDLLEALAFVQHYNGKTNLLDWTRSAYVASWFAFNGSSEKQLKAKQIAIWAVDIRFIHDQLKSRFNTEEGHLNVTKEEHLIDNVRIIDDKWNKGAIYNRNGVFPVYAKQEDLADIKLEKLKRRMAAQEALFLWAHSEDSFLDNLCFATQEFLFFEIKRRIKKILLPSKEKKMVNRFLLARNISREVLLPKDETDRKMKKAVQLLERRLKNENEYYSRDHLC